MMDPTVVARFAVQVPPGPAAQLIEMKNLEDPFAVPQADVAALQMKAAQELFEAKRAAIPVLDRRARETGVTRIETAEDIVPLLLSHTAYKSYPEALLTNRKWAQLAKWLSIVSSADYSHVDVDDAVDIDDFLDRMWAAGFKITTSSGTGGKLSLLPKSEYDIALYREFQLRTRGWPEPIEPRNQFRVFIFGPTKGTYTAAFAQGWLVEYFAKPGEAHVLIEEPMRNATLMRMAAMRKKLIDGTGTPGEIEAFRQEAAAQAERLSNRLDEMIRLMIETRHEPQYIVGMAPQMFEVVERARKLGFDGGDFHPDTVARAGGGKKHVKLPDDFAEQIDRFFGITKPSGVYGMTELSWNMPQCEAGRYHSFPWMIPLVLDEEGERLVGPLEGEVTGRFACLDLAQDLRWGGLISGDRVTIDYGCNCPCGRKSITFLPDIVRYADLKGDDKIACSGTVDAYIRGEFV